LLFSATTIHKQVSNIWIRSKSLIYCIGAGRGASVGRLIQRFPAFEWPDVPFIHGVEVVSFYLVKIFTFPLSLSSFANHKDGH
jgi:hypothetical protein